MIQKPFSFHYWTLLLVLFAFSARAQQGNFKNYTVNDGLAQSQVYSITEAANGYLWVGTRGGGLCQFDGLAFETFTKKDGLPSNYITQLYQDQNNQLWIGTSNGLCVYKDHQFKTISLDTLTLNTIINTILEDATGRLWVGTNRGLFYLKGDNFERKTLSTTEVTHEITATVEAPNDGLWVGTNRGLMLLTEDSIQAYTIRDGLSNNYIRSLVYDQNDNLWIGTYGKGISILTEDGIDTFDPLSSLNQSIIHALVNDTKGNIWIATLSKGLAKWNHSDSTLSYFSEADGLANNHVRCVFEDSWNNLWVGTSGGGMSKFSGQHFDHYNATSTQLKSNYIYAVEAVNDSDIWISTSGLGVNRYYKNNTFYYGSKEGFVDAKVKVIYQSKDSTVWLGTEGKGLFFFQNDTFLTGDLNRNVGSMWIKDIKEDAQKNIWVATSGGGICKITVDRSEGIPQFAYKQFTRSTGLTSNRVSLLHIDKDDKVWFAYQTGGLGYIEGDSLVHHVSSKEGVNASPIRSMVEDDFKHLFIGTGGKGVYRLDLYADTLSFTNFTSEQLLSSDNIYLLDIDLKENLWVGSEKGVEKIKLDNEGNLLEATTFGVDEGFKGVETSKNAITVDTKGGVWIGTINGLFRYNANYKSNNNKAPVLSITDVSLFYASIKETLYAEHLKSLQQNKKALLVLEHDQNHITFDFKGLVLTKPNQVQYKWKLLGAESKWSPVTKKTSITYSNLNAGKYVFQVLSSNEDGVWNKTPQTLAFEVLAPFWKTTWFIIAFTSALLLLISLIVWSRIRTINRKAKTAQELLKMENEVLVLEQKALRLQMNPHFIFNCLNSIQSMIVKKDHKTARYFLSKFSKLMRKTLDNSREQLILLDDEIETLENYLSIEKFCNEDHFEYEITVADNLASDFVQLPPMLIQPFVENAIVHGVAHKKSGGKINIDFSVEGNILSCTITDNGVGRTKAAELNKNRKASHKSTALIVTQERLDYLGGDAEKQLMIEDLTDGKGNPCGTKVTLQLLIAD